MMLDGSKPRAFSLRLTSSSTKPWNITCFKRGRHAQDVVGPEVVGHVELALVGDVRPIHEVAARDVGRIDVLVEGRSVQRARFQSTHTVSTGFSPSFHNSE